MRRIVIQGRSKVMRIRWTGVRVRSGRGEVESLKSKSEVDTQSALCETKVEGVAQESSYEGRVK